MNKEEFFNKRKDITNEWKEKIKELSKEYAFSNSPIKVGDIIENHCEIIQVEIIRYTSTEYYEKRLPLCTYSGPKLTKTLVPFKSGEKSKIWQSDVKDINGKPYEYEESEK